MLNIIRADFYRIFRGKAFYFTFGLLVLLSLLEVVPREIPQSGGAEIGINTDVSFGDTNFIGRVVTGAVSARLLLTVTDNLIYFLIPLFIAAAMAVFSCGAVKNSLSAGIPRVRLYFSKWFVSNILCVLAVAVYFAAGILAASALRGFGEWPGGYVSVILRALGAQLILLLGINCVGVFLSFAVRKTAAVTGIYIAFALIVPITFGILSNTHPSVKNFFNYDITICMKMFSYIENMTGVEVLRGILLGAGYMVASTVAGILIFRRAEIK